jgi:hypothetical protein
VRIQPAPAAKHTVDIGNNTVSANTGKLGGGGIHVFAHVLDHVTGAIPGVVARISANSIIGNHAQGSLLEADVFRRRRDLRRAAQ